MDKQKKKFLADCVKIARIVQQLHFISDDHGPYYIEDVNIYGPAIYLKPKVFLQLFKNEKWTIVNGKFRICIDGVSFEAPIPKNYAEG